MDVRIGVTYSPKELDIELPDDVEPGTIKKEIESALGSGSVVWVTDRRGRQVGVPADKVAYIELGSRHYRRSLNATVVSSTSPAPAYAYLLDRPCCSSRQGRGGQDDRGGPSSARRPAAIAPWSRVDAKGNLATYTRTAPPVSPPLDPDTSGP